MTNLWAFLLQTLTASLVAGLLLLLKALMEDKLSPRWQYGIWGLLGLRLLIPAFPNRWVIFPLPLGLELARCQVEAGLSSAYTSLNQALGITGPLPWVTGAPRSITDWLFCLYLAGVVFFWGRTLFRWARLRHILKKQGAAPSPALLEKIEKVREKYHLPRCRVVLVEGLESPFVCGGFPSLLALPAGKEPDEKVLLHELLHLKYHDNAQHLFWAFLRGLHWCNPFLWYCFDRIGNDLESLCDQRVLERLEGEERREYGVILLDMASTRYPRCPGTTSISNGSKNIARRIAAIARFKKYPRGMALVSVCIGLALAGPLLMGAAPQYSTNLFTPVSESELELALAAARLNRCTTVAGALDTWAKGILLENGAYLATVTPLNEHPDLEAEMVRSIQDGWVAYHLDSGDWMDISDPSQGYEIYNLTPNGDGYIAQVVMATEGFLDPDTGLMVEDQQGATGFAGSVLFQVSLTRADGGWVVEELSRTPSFHSIESYPWLEDWEESPLAQEYRTEGDFGTLQVGVTAGYRPEKYPLRSQGWTGTAYLDNNLYPDMEFSEGMLYCFYQYQCNLENPDSPQRYVQIQLLCDPEYIPGTDWGVDDSEGIGGGGSNGTQWDRQQVIDGWDGFIPGGSGGGVGLKDGLVKLPQSIPVQIYWDGQLKADLVLGGEAG